MYRVLSCLTEQHDYRLVAIAGMVCLMSCLSAFWLFPLARNRRGSRQTVLLLLCGICTAAGIWTTHFVAMLAYDGGLPVTYDGALTATSLAIAIFATSVGFALMATRAWFGGVLGGAVIGAGIAAMHFTGMASILAGGSLSWDGPLVIASIAIGIALAAFSGFAHRRCTGSLSSLAAPLLLTLAICGMHFTAMGAATFTPDPTIVISTMQIDNYSLAVIVTGISVLITLACIFATIIERFTIARSMLGFGGTVLATLTATVVISAYTLEQVRIGGDSYSRIVGAKDLIADILPPPLFIVEAYLETRLAAETPDRIVIHQRRLADLRKDYETRLAHWRVSTIIPEALKRSLTEDSDRLVGRFWTEVDSHFIPALVARDQIAITRSLQTLTASYSQHKKIIEEVVERANGNAETLELSAVSRTNLLKTLVLISVLALIVVIATALAAMRHLVVAPVLSMASYLRALAAGRIDQAAPFAVRTDEIGAMAGAVETLRQASIEKQRLENEAVETRRRSDLARAAREKEKAREAMRLNMANESISTLNEELSSTIAQLQQVQDEIVRKGKLAQLGQLTATVAHEIRNPLGAIKTAVYLIERKTKDKGLGVEGPMQRVNNGIKRCDSIITELLDFTRTKALALSAQPTDAWVASIIEEERRNIPAQVVLISELDAGAVPLQFDESRMRRVLVNLLSNASEAMVGKAHHGGGGDLGDGATAEPRIIVGTRIVEGNVEISVADNGPGISPENIARIREPLFTTKSFGVGLGIPAVENILDVHGGGLRIDSTLGAGTTMTAWFPVKLGTSKAIESEAQKVA